MTAKTLFAAGSVPPKTRFDYESSKKRKNPILSCRSCGGAGRAGPATGLELLLLIPVWVGQTLELETKFHPKVRNHGEGPY